MFFVLYSSSRLGHLLYVYVYLCTGCVLGVSITGLPWITSIQLVSDCLQIWFLFHGSEVCLAREIRPLCLGTQGPHYIEGPVNNSSQGFSLYVRNNISRFEVSIDMSSWFWFWMIPFDLRMLINPISNTAERHQKIVTKHNNLCSSCKYVLKRGPSVQDIHNRCGGLVVRASAS